MRELTVLNLSTNIYFTAEEKIRNYKMPSNDQEGADSIPSFLLKTYEILENSKYSDIICWTKSGEGFVVKKVKEFAETVLPTHFRHSNYTSFVRQLNMYDFHKTRQQNQENAFKNSMFKRGHKHLLKEILRKDYKKKKQKPESNQKPGATIVQNQAREDKKVEHQKQFYVKGLSILQKINQQMSLKQSQLAIIEDSHLSSTDQQISSLLQFIFGIKNINNTWCSQLSVLGKQWQNLLNSRKSGLKLEAEAEKSQQMKKNIDPTMISLSSFSHQN